MNPYEPHNDSFKPTAGPGPNSMAFRANLAPTSTTQDDDMYRLPDVPAHFQTDPAASSALPIDPSLMSGPAGAKEGNSAPPPRKKRKKSPAQPTKRKKRVETPVEADEESDGDDDGAGSSPPASGRARSVSLAASATTGKTAGRPSTKNAFKVKLPKGIDVPPIPTLFQGHSNLGKLLDSVKQVVVAGGGEARVFDGEGEDVMKEEQLQELDRAMNPELAISLLTDLAHQREKLDKAYEALNNELFKTQIEENVLNNVQMLLVEQRERLRKAQTG